MTKMPLQEAHNPNTPKGKTVQLFIGPPDGHAAFTTSLRLDARFAKMPRVLLLHLLAAPDAPPVLRSKPVNRMSTRVRAPAKCHDAFKIFCAPAARTAYSNSPSPSSLTWPMSSS